jgi:hypothetical protein
MVSPPPLAPSLAQAASYAGLWAVSSECEEDFMSFPIVAKTQYRKSLQRRKVRRAAAQVAKQIEQRLLAQRTGKP